MVIVAPLLAAALVVRAVLLALRRRRATVAASTELRLVAASLGLVALELRAGAAPAEALAAASESVPATALPWLQAAAEAGDLTGAAAALLAAPPALGSLGVALRLTATTGASLAPLCERLAAAAVAEEGARRELDEGMATARSTAALLTGLPLAGIGLAALIGAHPLALLLGGSGLGAACLLLGVGLACAGQSWTHALLRRAERRALG